MKSLNKSDYPKWNIPTGKITSPMARGPCLIVCRISSARFEYSSLTECLLTWVYIPKE